MALASVDELLKEDLFKLLGVEDASQENKSKLLAELSNLVEARIVNRIASLLSDEDSQKFASLAEAGDSQGIVEFLVNKEIDLPLVVSEETTRARVEFVELMRLARGE